MADLVAEIAHRVSQRRLAKDPERPAALDRNARHSGQQLETLFGQRAPALVIEGTRRRIEAAAQRHPDFFIAVVRQQLDFTERRGPGETFGPVRAAQLGQDRVQTRRHDQAGVDRNQAVGLGFKEAQPNFAVRLKGYFQLGLIAVIPRVRGVDGNLSAPGGRPDVADVADAAQSLPQDLTFCGGLELRAQVLVLTSAAAPEVRARRLDAPRDRLENSQRPSVDHALGGAHLLDLDAFARKGPGYQHDAALMVSQGLAAVNELLWREFEWHKRVVICPSSLPPDNGGGRAVFTPAQEEKGK